MRKIAIIAGGTFPIPATRGGATETMLTHLIEQNEKQHMFDLTVLCYYEKEAEQIAQSFQNTKIVYYNHNQYLDLMCSIPSRLLRKITNGKTYVRTRFVRWCAKCIIGKPFDLVFVEGNYFQILQLRKAIENPIILHMHIDGLNTSTDNAKRIVQSCKGIIAISDYCKNRIVEIDRSAENKVHVLKNMIPIDHFKSDGRNEVRIQIRVKFKIADKQKLFLYCGRVTPEKGVKELVNAFVKMEGNAALVIIGSSFYMDAGKSRYFNEIEEIAKNNPDKKIIFTGYIPQTDLPNYYSAADIAVVPSICQEAAGNVIIEALACELPVITSSQGGIPEYADEKACILVDYDSDYVKKLREAMELLANNEDLFEEKKKYARSIAIKYDECSYYENFCELMKKISQ